MGDTNKLCYGCFEPIGDEVRCPNCGHKQKSPYSPSYIAPGTMLNDRYMVGKLISHNGEGATYLAFDTVISCKILIKEYMPDALCTRVKGSPMIAVNHGCNVQYKSLMEEFTELNKKLAKLRSSNHINPVLDLFSENNTTYAVFEYIDGKNLIGYLKDNAGELSWDQIVKMFPPLFTSLSQLHNAGIVHRGISPQTLYITSKNELKLTDFCIAAVRTAKTELNAEIFKGYAAPEQYSPSSRQGTWTDVYGICAVLYRVLTGCMPTEALLRNEDDDITPPSSINEDISENVSKAIMDGLKISGDKRIQTITDLVTRIFEPSDDEKKYRTRVAMDALEPAPKKTQHTRSHQNDYFDDNEYKNAEKQEHRNDDKKQVYYKASVRKAPEHEEVEISFLDRIKFPVFLTGLLLIVVIILVLFIKSLNLGAGANKLNVNLPELTTPTTPPVTTVVTEPANTGYITNVPPATVADVTTTPVSEGEETDPDSTTANAGVNPTIQMPDLIGKIYEEVKLSILSQDVTFELNYEFKEGHQKGEILDQSIKSGTWITSGELVTLTVCKGNGSVTVPDYKRGPMSCYPISDFLAILDEAGIKYKAIPEVNTAYLSGYVIGTEPKAGTLIDSLAGDVVIVHFTDNSGNGSVILADGVSASAQAAEGITE